jgi:alpha,alpha-trehalase
VINSGVERYRQLNSGHLEALRSGSVDEDGLYLLVQTNQSHLQIAEAARTQVFCAGPRLNVRRHTVKEQGFIAQELEFDLTRGEPITTETVVALYTLPGLRHCGM